MILALNVAMAAAAATVPCSRLSVQPDTCKSGTVASPVDIKACSSELCAAMDTWGVAHGTEPGMALAGRGYGCVYEAISGVVSSVICVNGSSPKPTPKPTPVPCSRLSVQPDTCKSGTVASPVDIKACSSELCAAMDAWEMARGTEPGMALAGRGFGCVYEPVSGVVVSSVICVNGSSPKPDPNGRLSA